MGVLISAMGQKAKSPERPDHVRSDPDSGRALGASARVRARFARASNSGSDEDGIRRGLPGVTLAETVELPPSAFRQPPRFLVLWLTISG